MQQDYKENAAQKKFEEFLEYRKDLSEFDKRVEAGAIIQQIETVDIDKGFEKIQHRIDNKDKSVNLINYFIRVAAILSIPLLMITIWSLFLQNKTYTNHTDFSWQELSSPVGMRSQIILPDGTKLWLNSQSTIRYRIPFVNESRIVELKGEAFLNVMPDEEIPFLVKAGTTQVEVVGTEFNVKAYPEEENIEVALLEGKVKFAAINENQQKYLELSPGDYMVFNKSEGQAKRIKTDVEKYAAWRKNVLILDETPIEEVAVLLQRWYGVKVVIQDEELKKYKFTTTFENESLFRVLELLELSSPDIKVKYTPGKVNDQFEKTNQSTVLITLKTKTPM
ncbi:DUF4974 domain-containing protein [Maribellus comscasis]|uniref:DUF4974 domain-containing protein n=1 Tax=Maribellus comscasis TaxID=2681766 RepID=A0A6I6JZG1_9BACT|nr:FecR domain-containing protein [Maribellus comscasis]QGY45602.1 DUF4974 domain-containing protein [Maribellus comscasis]